MAETQQQALDLAGGLSVVLAFEFPDIDDLRQPLLDAENSMCSSTDPKQAKAALRDLKAVKDRNAEEFKVQRDIIRPAMEAAKAALKEQVKAQM